MNGEMEATTESQRRYSERQGNFHPRFFWEHFDKPLEGKKYPTHDVFLTNSKRGSRTCPPQI